MIPKTITNNWLHDNSACADQRELFRATFPDGMPVNLRNLKKAQRSGLDIYWLAGQLSPEALRIYDAAMAEPLRIYNAAMVEPQRIYKAAMAEALRIYDAARAEALRIYDAARAEPLRIYDAARAEPLRIYNAAMAEAQMAAIRSEWRVER